MFVEKVVFPFEYEIASIAIALLASDDDPTMLLSWWGRVGGKEYKRDRRVTWHNECGWLETEAVTESLFLSIHLHALRSARQGQRVSQCMVTTRLHFRQSLTENPCPRILPFFFLKFFTHTKCHYHVPPTYVRACMSPSNRVGFASESRLVQLGWGKWKHRLWLIDFVVILFSLFLVFTNTWFIWLNIFFLSLSA